MNEKRIQMNRIFEAAKKKRNIRERRQILEEREKNFGRGRKKEIEREGI